MIIGSGNWGNKVNSILNQSGIRSKVVGARVFISEEENQKELNFFDLIWICSTPELQLQCIKKILELTETKILIEKPITFHSQINNEIRSLIENHHHIFISRPWNFSSLWRSFLEECLSEGEIVDIEISHSGESSRHYINPPQDWLHHDLCLLQELLKLKDYQNFNYEVEWSEERHRLDILGKGIISIKIGGGLSTNRNSAFQVTFKNNTKILMDMIENKYYKFSSKGEEQEFKFTNNDSLHIMVNHFINLSFYLRKNNDEKEKLQILGLLSSL